MLNYITNPNSSSKPKIQLLYGSPSAISFFQKNFDINTYSRLPIEKTHDTPLVLRLHVA